MSAMDQPTGRAERQAGGRLQLLGGYLLFLLTLFRLFRAIPLCLCQFSSGVEFGGFPLPMRFAAAAENFGLIGD